MKSPEAPGGFGGRVALLCLVQCGVLLYAYSAPSSDKLSGFGYGVVLLASSGMLTMYSYWAMQWQRPGLGLLAGLLAFPGFLLLLGGLLFLY